MSMFDNIIEDAATRFGLGAKAGPLLRELLQLMTSSPGGIGGFIDKFKSAGLSREVSGWFGNANGATLTSSQVEQALGSKTVDTIAQKVGLTGGAASAAIGYLAPKVIGQLTPGGTIGTGIPGSVSDFLRSSTPAATLRTEQPMPYSTAVSQPSPLRWIAPLLALLALGGLGWYFLADRMPSPVSTAFAPASTVPSQLAISNDNGVITFSGTVRDEAARASITDTLKSVFGSNAVKGDLVIDPNAAPTPWLSNLRAGLEQMKTPGLHAVFAGNSLNLGGTVSDADRDRILSSLKSTFGSSGLTFAAADQISSLVSDATSKAAAALAALGTGFQTTDLLTILNKSIINFPTGSAEIPTTSRALLQQAAIPFKQLPSSTVVEISGYTDNAGDPVANQQLSQRRADAVRNALIQSGVNPGTLTAKGYGSANPVASNDTPEGRFQNRRIAYEVTGRNPVTEGSAGSAK